MEHTLPPPILITRPADTIYYYLYYHYCILILLLVSVPTPLLLGYFLTDRFCYSSWADFSKSDLLAGQRLDQLDTHPNTQLATLKHCRISFMEVKPSAEYSFVTFVFVSRRNPYSRRH